MNDPDSVVEYVRWLDARHYRLTSAVSMHRANKQDLAIAGSIDAFDRHLWSVLDGLEDADE